MNADYITCERRLQFCAGHRVMGHENKCGHLHGHNYVAYITAAAEEKVPAAVGNYKHDPGRTFVDAIGRVIDFSVLKAKFGDWIDREWDHGFILHADDTPAFNAIHALPASNGARQKLYTMQDNPTAENMARHLLLDIAPHLMADTGVRIVRVRIEETENCSAVAALKGWQYVSD